MEDVVDGWLSGAAPAAIAVVAVVDAHDSTAVVWWVDVEEPSGLNRLCGAWVLPQATSQQLEALTFRRFVLTTPAGADLMAALDVCRGTAVDAEATLTSVARVVEELDQAHQAHVQSLPGSRNLVAPTWPVLPRALDAQHVAADASGDVARTLGIAGWLTSLCSAWSTIEAQRTARSHLHHLGGRDARHLPLCRISDAMSTAAAHAQ